VSGYAANVEKCEIGPREGTLDAAPTGELAEVHTPNLPGIEEVGEFMKVKTKNMLKTIVFEVVGANEPDAQARTTKWVLAVVRGDHEVNEDKVKKASGYSVALAPEKEARAAGFAIGYVSPRMVKQVKNTMLLVDFDAAQGGFWATGADKPDYH